MAKCPKCGAEIPEGKKFCGECGAPVSADANTNAIKAPKANQNNKNLKTCKHCGQLVSKKAKKCPHCGAKLKHTGLVIIAVILGLALISSIGSKDDKSTSSSSSSSSTTSSSFDTTSSKSDSVEYEITDIKNVIDTSVLSLGNGQTFNVVIEVTNTGNVPMYLKGCVLDYEDDDGHLLQTYDFLSKTPDVVQPGEKGYFYTNGSPSFDEGVSFDKGCNLVPTVTIEKAKGTLKSHEVIDTSIYDNSFGSVGVKGRIVNDTSEDVSLIYVTTVFYDSNGKVLGISGTNVTDIKANGKTSFDDSGMLMKEFKSSDVASFKVYADEMYLQF